MIDDWIHSSNEPLPLFDVGATAKQTRAASNEDAKPKRSKRVEEAERILRDAGAIGCTRHELASRFCPPIPLPSICPIALALIDEGKAFERGTRLSPYEKPAAVIVHRDHAQGGGK